MYNDELPKATKPSEALIRIGDKYKVNGLVSLCAKKFSKQLNNDNAFRLIKLFHSYWHLHYDKISASVFPCKHF
jgi:hypothetical protein